MSGAQHTHSWSKKFQKLCYQLKQRLEVDPVFEEAEEEEGLLRRCVCVWWAEGVLCVCECVCVWRGCMCVCVEGGVCVLCLCVATIHSWVSYQRLRLGRL